MAKSKKRQRRRKHRGTQGGSVERRGRTSRPRSRAEARSQYRSQRASRLDRPPSWRSALTRALIATAVFAGIVFFVFRQPAEQAWTLVLFMFMLYVPLGYMTDSLMYRRRQRQRERQAQAAREAKATGKAKADG